MLALDRAGVLSHPAPPAFLSCWRPAQPWSRTLRARCSLVVPALVILAWPHHHLFFGAAVALRLVLARISVESYSFRRLAIANCKTEKTDNSMTAPSIMIKHAKGHNSIAYIRQVRPSCVNTLVYRTTIIRSPQRICVYVYIYIYVFVLYMCNCILFLGGVQVIWCVQRLRPTHHRQQRLTLYDSCNR